MNTSYAGLSTFMRPGDECEDRCLGPHFPNGPHIPYNCHTQVLTLVPLQSLSLSHTLTHSHTHTKIESKEFRFNE